MNMDEVFSTLTIVLGAVAFLALCCFFNGCGASGMIQSIFACNCNCSSVISFGLLCYRAAYVCDPCGVPPYRYVDVEDRKIENTSKRRPLLDMSKQNRSKVPTQKNEGRLATALPLIPV